MMVQPHKPHNHGIYDNNGEACYFPCDDDNMSYECVLSITDTLFN